MAPQVMAHPEARTTEGKSRLWTHEGYRPLAIRSARRSRAKLPTGKVSASLSLRTATAMSFLATRRGSNSATRCCVSAGG
jgi:hypothetical protein